MTNVITRYMAANNPQVPDYDPTKPQNYILYIDANNLYGFSMCDALPQSDFEWVEDVTELDVQTIPDDSDVGYFLEVDVHVPRELHDKFNDLPLLPENKIPPNGKTRKLLSTLEDKTNYIIHYRNLKQALSMGLVLTKTHRAISFRQSPWMRPFIQFNTEKRKSSTDSFSKDFFKLMNNASFGKTMENVRKRVNMQIVTSEGQFLKLVKKPNFKNRTIINENVVCVHMEKEKILLNKPIYVGFSILEISKIVMYDFYYHVLMGKYSQEALKLLYLDTDSFIVSLTTDDLEQDLTDMTEHLDLSDYPEGHKCRSVVNKKRLGKFKDEVPGDVITHFVGLRPKMYCYKTANNWKEEEKDGKCRALKKCKGIKRSCLKSKVTYNHYLQTLQTRQALFATFKCFRTDNHRIYTVTQNKKALTADDDKRTIHDDYIHTDAHGYNPCDD